MLRFIAQCVRENESQVAGKWFITITGQMSMRKAKRFCAQCGRAISFAYIHGKVRPMHDDGKPCGAGGGERQRLLPFPQIFTAAFEHPVTSGPCRCPAAPTVFLVQHRDGVARFDRLEWPWKRHQCDHTGSGDFGLDHMKRQLDERPHEWVKLALVAGTKQSWALDKPFHHVALIVCANPDHRHCLKVRCEDETPAALQNRARILSGALVVMTGNGVVKRLLTSSGYGFECVDDHASPEELDIPAEWLDDGDDQNIRI